MPADPRSNPLALAVLICVAERPMHPYEAASTLRERQKHKSVRLNYGSLYAVVASLERRGLVAPHETVRSGRLPERTVYAITDAGRTEASDWLAQLISIPVRDYTSFEAALSFLPALPPDEVVELLKARAQQLEHDSAQREGSRGLLGSQEVPRLFWVEEEYRTVLREAELQYVRQLIQDISEDSLQGLAWWKQIHADQSHAPPPTSLSSRDGQEAPPQPEPRRRRRRTAAAPIKDARGKS